MKRLLAGACCALLCLVSRSAEAQVPSPSPTTAQPVRVFLTCAGCDAALKTCDVRRIRWRTASRRRSKCSSSSGREADARSWVFTYTGKGAFAGGIGNYRSRCRRRMADEVRAGLVRVFKFGLVDTRDPVGCWRSLDVSFAAPETEASLPPAPARGSRSVALGVPPQDVHGSL